MQIVLCYPLEPRHLQQIGRCAAGAKIVDAGQGGIYEAILRADVFCGHAKVPVDWRQVVRRGQLRWIQSSAAGVDHCLVPPVVSSDIVVTSASGVLADQVAEHAIALITGLVRGLPRFFRAQQQRQFERLPTRDLHRSTVGLVGFGGVGRRLAELLATFHTRILATDWFPVDRPDHVQALWPPDGLDALLAACDIVVLCLPLTPHSRGIIDRRALQKMRPGSILVNVARGALVVEKDLVAALVSGHLGGAALDVTEEEPLPTTSQLWDLPEVLITPHVAGQSAHRADNMTDFFCDNLGRYLAGKPLLNVVDKHLGFPRRGV